MEDTRGTGQLSAVCRPRRDLALERQACCEGHY